MDLKEIEYSKLSDKLVEIIPSLRPAYSAMLKDWKDQRPGPHVVYGDLLVPHIITSLKDGGNDAGLKVAFDFMEALLSHPDKEIGNVVGATICESLCDDEVALQKASRHMGPLVKGACRAILNGK